MRKIVIALIALAAVALAEDESLGNVIGIDLGTTYSCVGVYRKGQVEIIPNEQGNRITPSYVAWDDKERMIGDAAKNQATINPERTVFDVKRMIGRKFDDPSVQKDRKMWPFHVLDKKGKPVIKVVTNNGDKEFSPEEISAMVLSKMKQIAESYLGEEKLLSQYLLTSMMLSVRLLRMQERLQVWLFSVSSMNLRLLLLLMVWIRRMVRRIFWCSIWEVVRSM